MPVNWWFNGGTMPEVEIEDVTEIRADDALFALELDIARKADELARSQGREGDLSLHCWLMAEAEVLGSQPVERLMAAAN